ncbi:alpha-L-arabinofuranosidase C-terminal domain-containing protein [Limibacter armeniacum]|uniref:alpha-L-arabinofuranosidase C-terminal domain-containing protein n=1 Tax=Limibacter armeniacum TaxID=466084 RepID=UPI002FE573A3
MKKIIGSALIAGSLFTGNAMGQNYKDFTVQTDHVKAEIQPTMWGIFFEDINFAADGGIYAELVKNRSFEFYTPLMGWEEKKSEDNASYITVMNRSSKDSANPRYAQIKLDAEKEAFTLTNEGFRGMGLKEGLSYSFSLNARTLKGAPVTLHIELLSHDNKVVGKTSLKLDSPHWDKFTASLKSTVTDPKGKLRLSFEGKSTVDIDMVSMFPSDTWKNRPNGLRADLIQKLADLNPGFLRFPGGCIVEGRELATRYQWKKTVGNLEDRKVQINRWNTEFDHRPTHDYFQSFGVGFFEYFQLSEDLNAEPLPILSCGMACQFNTGELVPMDQLDPYIQDALDLIEFANGDVSTPWGKLRKEMGHPAPFDLKYIGVGNEQWGPQYIERYKVFAKAIKEKYPEIIIVSGTGPFPDGKEFDYAAEELKKLDAEIVDEHYYRNPEWFLENADRYDNYDRSGPKIFAGEYAAQSVAIASPDNKNNWQCALSEAAFMTGLERNADVVHLSSYAPLFAHAEGWQWTPDLIWFDNLNSYATPNYYVQQLFSTNKGTQVVEIGYASNEPVTGQEELYASAVLDEKNNQLILKIVNSSSKDATKTVRLEGDTKTTGKGSITVLKSEALGRVNSFDNPENIHPTTEEANFRGKKLTINLPAYSLTVVKINLKESNL